ncbi:TPA: hypothetical protein ACGUP3_000262 [Vibrio vulnificus]
MVDGRSKIVANSKVVLILKAAYIVAVLLITQTLVDEHTLLPWSYVLFAITMIMALFSPSHKIKYVCALIATSYLFVGGIVDPLDIDVIEETFILLPLCYLLLFPGTIWAFVVALLLTASYFYTVPPEGLDELIEDAIELLVISAFASIMVYYQQIVLPAINQIPRRQPNGLLDATAKPPSLLLGSESGRKFGSARAKLCAPQNRY